MQNLDGKRLGRGLATLLGASISNNSGNNYIEMLEIESIQPNAQQPRKHFDELKLGELTESIKSHGILQPIIVTPGPDDSQYLIIAGERRWRAARIVGLSHIPAIIKKSNTQQIIEIALIENLQREDLNVVEECTCYAGLIKNFHYTHESLAQTLGKSRSHITNILRLQHLPEIVKQMVVDGLLTYGHARALIHAENIDFVVEKIIGQNLSVRQTEELIKRQKAEPHIHAHDNENKSQEIGDLKLIAENLHQKHGLRFNINARNNSYEIKLTLQNLEELDAVLTKFF